MKAKYTGSIQEPQNKFRINYKDQGTPEKKNN